MGGAKSIDMKNFFAIGTSAASSTSAVTAPPSTIASSEAGDTIPDESMPDLNAEHETGTPQPKTAVAEIIAGAESPPPHFDPTVDQSGIATPVLGSNAMDEGVSAPAGTVAQFTVFAGFTAPFTTSAEAIAHSNVSAEQWTGLPMTHENVSAYEKYVNDLASDRLREIEQAREHRGPENEVLEKNEAVGT